MPATAKTPDARPDPLDLYRHRDDLAAAFNPANAYERMLVTQAAQAWQRLQRASEAEERYFQDHDIVDAITNRSTEFKAITRYISDCTRAWRQACAALEKIKRERKRDLSSPNARRNSPPEPKGAIEYSAAEPAPIRLIEMTGEAAVAARSPAKPTME